MRDLVKIADELEKTAGEFGRNKSAKLKTQDVIKWLTKNIPRNREIIKDIEFEYVEGLYEKLVKEGIALADGSDYDVVEDVLKAVVNEMYRTGKDAFDAVEKARLLVS